MGTGKGVIFLTPWQKLGYARKFKFCVKFCTEIFMIIK